MRGFTARRVTNQNQATNMLNHSKMIEKYKTTTFNLNSDNNFKYSKTKVQV
ncbi:hypothetical protein HanXRQr2_Chr06g0260011 [Helianthus annuus]|uniref:Uncharacterized protein n=1 Tax=Helianthus annuus TaxID=4232 RepID=A0A9K3ISX4_HELAN|nr:hypothetical protein HanXRQr2_Chr06g0260011 [Helianthus annuus]